MLISSTLRNRNHLNQITVSTDNSKKELSIPAKATGLGSSVSGGEFLLLSLATCVCNDIYREAARRKIVIDALEVTVSGEFGKEGEPATNIIYVVEVTSSTSPTEELDDLITHVDAIAEIHNTLRRGASVTLKRGSSPL